MNLDLQTGAHTLICRSTAHIDHSEAGQRRQFEIKIDKAHLFDSATTQRIA